MAHQQDINVEHLDSARVIIVAVDGSSQSDRAMDFYFGEIRRPSDRLVLVHIPESYDYNMTSETVFEQLKADVEKRVKSVEENCEVKLAERNIKNAKFRTAAGKPGEKIIEIAKEEDAHLVITGTRGLGKVRRTFLGSVSDYVLHHSHVPVLVCRN